MQSKKPTKETMRVKIFGTEVVLGQGEGGILEYSRDLEMYVMNDDGQIRIENEVNEFCNTHDVVSVTPSCVTHGNNPPTALMMYSIVYRG